MENQESKITTIWNTLKYFWIECKRVFAITKKPDMNEFKTIVKISGLGILAIGFIGFIIHLIKEVFRLWN